ncbi:MAG: DUF4153 domain-containing protein [Saprospiraceae bacterium]
MKAPYSPTTQVSPPLPIGLVYPRPLPAKSKKLQLSETQATPYRKATAVIGLFTVVASLLTFKAGWGLNLPLVSAAALAVGFWRKPEMVTQTVTRVQLIVWLALAIAVILHFDPWTLVPFVIVTAVLLGSLLFGQGVDPMRAIARTMIQFGSIPWSYIKAFRYGRASLMRDEGVFHKLVRLTAFPVFIAIGFGTLYVWSNQTLSQWSFNFFDQILSGSWFVDSLQFGWSLFVSSVIGAGLVYGMKKQDGRLLKSIGITPTKLAESVSTWSSVSIALLLVNVLALVLNTVDGTTTWIGEISTSGAELKRGVHAGTYTLITAIVLAASYLLYNFRVQPKDCDRARLLAMAWLGQNLMMVFTVALRNYHYTDAYGLTIKRIGVWLFLCCTATGLYFLSRQVRENGAVERLVRRQAWAVYLILAIAAVPNWPGLITRYNHQEARMVLDDEYLDNLRPYNLDVWAEYNPDVIRRSTANYFALTENWFEAPQDFREWDLKSARRAALRRALPVIQPKAADAMEEAPLSTLHDVETVDEINYDVEPSTEVEVENLQNN